jgi:thiamine biosynthesis lipoprotein
VAEASTTFTCFGGECSVFVSGKGEAGSPGQAVADAQSELIEAHARFSRFKTESELTALNEDPRERVPVSPAMAGFVAAAVAAGEETGGLVDATLLDEIESAGYRDDRLRGSLALPLALALAPARRPAGPHPEARWREIEVDAAEPAVMRPPGVKLDGGGIVKGLLADQLAQKLSTHKSFAVDCEGDLRFGGAKPAKRAIPVSPPFSTEVLTELEVREGAIATSGITKRSWLGPDGKPAHHILDPATGTPAYTGVVQATALAPTTLEAEALAKAAVLSGPEGAPGWLRHGGVVVFDDGSHAVVPAP